MRTALKPLKSDTGLAAVLNAYMAGLTTAEIIATPHDCMSVCMRDFAKPDTKKKGRMARRLAQEYYQLVALGQSLSDYEWNAREALGVLDALFTVHKGDVDSYAIANRLHCIEEYGSDDESDWQQDGEDEEGPVWVPSQKSAAEAQERYGIMAELTRFFPGNGTRGECLGSSGPADFFHFTVVVRNQTQLGINKMFSEVLGKPLTMYRQDEDGQLQPMSQADEIESELNEDIRNASVSEAFDTVLFAGGVAHELFKSEAFAQARKLSLLHELLGRLVAADIKALPVAYTTPQPLF